MFHVGLQTRPKVPKEVNYSSLSEQQPQKRIFYIPDSKDTNDDVPDAPNGFMFYRIQSGDTLVSLSVRFGISQNKIRRYNSKVCFGHRLTHIIGKLLLIPIESCAYLSDQMKIELNEIYKNDENERNNHKTDEGDIKYSEPDENGKYQLSKALMFHAKGIDEHRAAYYLGESHWNVRKAFKLWKEDDKWEKKQRVIKGCNVNGEDAEELLNNHDWDVSAVILHWNKQAKKSKICAMEIEGAVTKNDDNETYTYQ